MNTSQCPQNCPSFDEIPSDRIDDMCVACLGLLPYRPLAFNWGSAIWRHDLSWSLSAGGGVLFWANTERRIWVKG